MLIVSIAGRIASVVSLWNVSFFAWFNYHILNTAVNAVSNQNFDHVDSSLRTCYMQCRGPRLTFIITIVIIIIIYDTRAFEKIDILYFVHWCQFQCPEEAQQAMHCSFELRYEVLSHSWQEHIERPYQSQLHASLEISVQSMYCSGSPRSRKIFEWLPCGLQLPLPPSLDSCANTPPQPRRFTRLSSIRILHRTSKNSIFRHVIQHFLRSAKATWDLQVWTISFKNAVAWKASLWTAKINHSVLLLFLLFCRGSYQTLLLHPHLTLIRHIRETC